MGGGSECLSPLAVVSVLLASVSEIRLVRRDEAVEEFRVCVDRLRAWFGRPEDADLSVFATIGSAGLSALRLSS